MPTAMPCVMRPKRTLPAVCYDRVGRKVPLEMERPPSRAQSVKQQPSAKKPPRQTLCEKEQQEALFQNRERFLLSSKSKKRPLPPGMVAPCAFRKPPPPIKPTKRRGTGGEATYFHVQGQPWESRGYVELKKEQVERMKAARPPTAEEVQAELELRKEEEMLNKEEEERVRSFFREIDEARRERELEVQRQIDAEVDDDDNEKAAEARRLMVLHRSLQARHANDVRVQEATRAIGAAKCSAMWTAQIEERSLMERLQAEHDVEQARKDTEFNESKWGKKSHQEMLDHNKRLEFGAAVRQQINDRRQLRHLTEERRREETRQMRDAYDEFKRFQAEQTLANGERKTSYRNELFHYIKLHQDFARMLCEQEQRDEMRANKYVIDKEKQRLEQRQQKAAVELDKERNRDALFVIQQKILDAKDNGEEMRLLAEHERLERKYRMQERKAVEHRRRQVEELRKGNEQALEEINKLKACYYAQRQREMDEMRLDRERYEQQAKLEQEKKVENKISLHRGVTAQMEEHERARRREIEQERLESDRARALELQRQKEVDLVINVKLDEVAKKRCLPMHALLSLNGRVQHPSPKKLSAHIQP